jgi:hypothetical protein
MPITPNTLDDFMKLFGAGSAPDAQQAAQYHDRFISTNPEDNHFDNNTYHQAVSQHLATLPDDQFHAAAKNAIAQTPPQQRQDLLTGLLGALGGAGGLSGVLSSLGGSPGATAGGGGLGQIAKMLGLGTTDPQQMSDDDAAKLMNYARTEHPEVIRQTVAEKPWFVKAMGNPVVMGALTMAAAKLLSGSRRSNA